MKDIELATRALAMRNMPTEPEKRLWRALSNSQLGGFKFRRQAVIGRFIVDFLCPAKSLIVEVDGDTHDPDRDARRDAWLAGQGYRTIRLLNAEVMGNREGVLTFILSAVAAAPSRWPHPNPSPEGEGLEAGQASSPCEGSRSRTRDLSPSPSGEGLGVGKSKR